MAKNKITINRAPVLTLWAAVVAERLGHTRQEALTLGKALAGLNAQSKGRQLGIYEDKSAEEKEKEKREARADDVSSVAILGRAIPVVKTPQGMRAAARGEALDPESVQAYLERKFGDELEASRAALEHLAKAYTPPELEARAFDLYVKFRPEIPEGKKGWGAKGEFDLDYVRSLAK